MADTSRAEVEQFMNGLIKRNPGEPEFHQAVQKVAETLMPFLLDATCVKYGQQPDGFVNYVQGANIGGFVKVADATLAYSIV